jgi:outer membrane protein OmpA-like peptidoglycan-associated protein
MDRLSFLKALVVLCALLAIPAVAQDTTGQQKAAPRTQVASGAKMKVQGVVLRRENGGVIMRDLNGSEINVRVANNTKIEEKKGNPFRGAKKYSEATLTRGLSVEVEGRGDASGALVADKIKFSDDSLRVAQSIDSTVVPIEGRIGVAEDRLTKSEQNAQRLAGQVEELGQVANLAKGGARAAQETADAAVDGVNRTNDRISSLDDYEVKKSTTVNFKVGSYMLSPEAKAMLDDIATQAKTEKGFIIEVRGFASSDGSENLNRRLSQERSDAVVRYLAEKHDISLRRIILPFGYGEAMPVADNSTRDGRIQNRRCEVKILVNHGLTAPVNVGGRSVSSNQ